MIKYLVFVGAIINLAGTSIYIKDMLRGKAKPNKVTWFIWGVAPMIAASAAISAGVTWAVIPVFTSGLVPLLVFIISLFKKEAYWEINTFDWVCGTLAILALILWYITKSPAIAIIFSILSGIFASLPTIIKAWKYPETESSIAYIGGLLSALSSFAAIEVWNFASLAFPINLVAINAILLSFIEHGRLFKRRRN